MRRLGTISIVLSLVVGVMVFVGLRYFVAHPVTGVAFPPSATPTVEDVYDNLRADEERLLFVPGARDDDDSSSIFDCTIADFVAEPGGAETNEEFDARISYIASTLEESDDAEYLLASVLLSRSGEPFSAPERMEKTLATGRRHPLVLYTAGGMCGLNATASFCGDAGFQNSQTSLLGRNGAHWLRRASQLYERGDTLSALAAMKRVSTEPQFDFYFIDYVMLLERALATASDMDYAQRIVAAISFVAAMPSPYLKMFERCRVQAAFSDDWLNACTAAAERMTLESNTMLERMVGFGYLDKFHELAGNEEARASAERRKDELEQKFRKYIAEGDVVIYSDPGLLARYIDAFATGGEMAAMEFAVSESERLRQDPDYDPCAAVARASPRSTDSDRE